MTRSVFDPTGNETERSGSRFTLPEAEQKSTEVETAEDRAAEADDSATAAEQPDESADTQAIADAERQASGEDQRPADLRDQ